MNRAIISFQFNRPDFLALQQELFAEFLPGADFIPFDCKPYAKGSPSVNHGTALNAAFEQYKGQYDQLMIIDHDLFPLKPYNPFKLLHDKKVDFAGSDCGRHLTPILLLIDQPARFTLDFTPEPGYDTAGKLRHLEGIYKFHTLEHNPVAFHAETIHGKYLHFRKGSNWHQDNPEAHEERIRNLKKYLDNLCSRFRS